MLMSLPQAVIFDAFGTLVKITEPKAPYRQLLTWMHQRGRAYQPTDAHTIMAHQGDLNSMAQRLGMQLPEDILQELNLQLTQELASIRLYDDSLQTIQHLQQQGIKVAICSNLAMPYGEIVEPMLPQLDAYGWSYIVGAIKPDAKIYHSVIDQLGCQAQDALFIGDTPLADVEGPTQLGMVARLIDRKAKQRLKAVLAEFYPTLS